jgi:hypothetical protein
MYMYKCTYIVHVVISLICNMQFNSNSAMFQLYHGENKIIFNEMMMRSTLY